MKWKIILPSIVAAILLLLCVYSLIPSNNYDEVTTNGNYVFLVPKGSKFVSECCMTVATFKSRTNPIKLNTELNNIIKKYQKLDCGEYYYDSEQDITITKYGISKKSELLQPELIGFLETAFYFEYTVGNYCE